MYFLSLAHTQAHPLKSMALISSFEEKKTFYNSVPYPSLSLSLSYESNLDKQEFNSQKRDGEAQQVQCSRGGGVPIHLVTSPVQGPAPWGHYQRGEFQSRLFVHSLMHGRM